MTDRYVFGAFTFAPDRLTLTCGDAQVEMLPKCIELLMLLLRNSKRVVSKDDIMRSLWQGEAVDESHVSQYVYRLRKILAQYDGQTYVTTVPKKGYRLAVPVVTQKAHAPKPAVDDETYRIFQQGRFLSEQRTEKGLREGLLRFEAVLSRTPDFAPAHLAVAETCCLLAKRQHVKSHIAFPRAQTAALRALELDPDLGEANAALGDVRLYYAYDPPGAEDGYRTALARNPSYGYARFDLAWMLAVICERFDEALEQINYALQSDPASAQWHTMFGIYLHAKKEYIEAKDYLESLLRVHPDNEVAQLFFALSLLFAGHKGAAVDAFGLMARHVERPFSLGYLGYSQAVSGDRRSAMRTLKRLHQLMGHLDQHGAYYSAIVYAGLGQTDRAIENLEHAILTREPPAIFMRTDPCFRSLAGEPRFEHLLNSMASA